MSLSDEEKRRFLRALEEDEEFRLAVAGLIGLREVLEELRRLREDSSKRFEAIERKLLEHDEKFRAVMEEIRRIWEEIGKIWRELGEMNRRLSSLELALGALTESSYARFVWEELREEIRDRGERLLQRRRNARLDGEDIDLLVVTDKTVYIVEVKVKPRHRDVAALLAKAELASKRYPDKRVVPVLAGAMIGSEIEEYALQKGVKVYTY